MLSTNYKTSRFQQKTKYGMYIKLCCILVSVLSLYAAFQVLFTSSYDKNDTLEDDLLRYSSRDEIINSNHTNQQLKINLHEQDRGHEIVDHKYIYSNAFLPIKPSSSIDTASSSHSFDTYGEIFDVDRNSNQTGTLRIKRDIGAENEESRLNDVTLDHTVPINEQIQERVTSDVDYSQVANNTESSSVPNGDSDAVTAGQGNDNQGAKRTLVSVTSRSGKFSAAILPLDDLIVSPAPEAQVNSNLNDQHPPISSDTEVGSQQQDSTEIQDGVGNVHQIPNLADLTALGTATGLLLGDLSAQQATPSNSYNPYENTDDSRFAHNLALQNAYARNEIPQSYNSAFQPDVQQNSDSELGASNYIQEPKQDLEDSPEKAPDSMESLMKSEADVMGSQNDGEDPSERSSSNLVQDENVGNYPLEASNKVDSNQEGDEEDDENSPNEIRQDNQMLIPQNIPMAGYSPEIGKQFGQSFNPRPFLDLPNGEQQLILPMRDSISDLNTAAGHYYGKKKKKKKVVVKKKKKKKKVKVVKYKVKKHKVKKVRKKKKKKPMKKHHDHGKYYM